VLKPQVTRD